MLPFLVNNNACIALIALLENLLANAAQGRRHSMEIIAHWVMLFKLVLSNVLENDVLGQNGRSSKKSSSMGRDTFDCFA